MQSELWKGDATIKHTDYEEYVCDYCFHQLPECTCDCGNFTLIQIDKALQYAIRILNEKGWVTKYCCEGHPTETTKFEESYICFYYWKPTECPEGWCCDGNCIRASYTSKSKNPKKRLAEMMEQKAIAIQALNKWVDELSEFNTDNYEYL